MAEAIKPVPAESVPDQPKVAPDTTLEELEEQKTRERNEVMLKRDAKCQEMLKKILAGTNGPKGYLNGESYDSMAKRANPADIMLGFGALLGLAYGLHRLFKGETLKGLAGLGFGGVLMYKIGTGEFPFSKEGAKVMNKSKTKAKEIYNNAENYLKKENAKSQEFLSEIDDLYPDLSEELKKADVVPNVHNAGNSLEEIIKNTNAKDFGPKQLKQLGVSPEVAEKVKPNTFESKKLFRRLIDLYSQGKKRNAQKIGDLLKENN